MATGVENCGITKEQLLELEDRHKRQWPKIGYYEHPISNQDVARLVMVVRNLTGWKRPDPTLFEKRLGAVANMATKLRRKRR